MTARIPNFRGQRALVLHPADRNGTAIVEQLERLGAIVEMQWPAERVAAADVDVVFFDSDLGFDELFAWEPGSADVPLIAILGSEAPGRIEWTLAQEPTAYLMKPIGSTGVFSALSIAFHNFALKRRREEALQRMGDRLQLRGTVLKAALTLMKRHGIGDEESLQVLRAEAMRRRLTLEAVSALVLEGRWIGPDAKPRKPLPRHAGTRVNSS
jgi:AmiR/NasT family two-component response regulator